MSGFLHPILNPTRLAYLRAVEANAPYEPRHGRCANSCLVLGWVESVVRMPDGSLRRWDGGPFDSEGEWVGQRLTDEGREMLRRADAEAT